MTWSIPLPSARRGAFRWALPATALCLASALPFAGCAADATGDGEPDPSPEGIALLGGYTHSLDSVNVEEIATSAEGLNGPRDLAFNPLNPGEVWVVNRYDDSTTTLFDAGTEDQTFIHRVDTFALHFMEEVSSISFGVEIPPYGAAFGTCQESRNTYNNQAAPNDFMGPSLWPSDMDVYGFSNPEAVAFLGYDLGSHLDMLHESPLCMGIEWERENIYWTFDGLDGTITRNDFVIDHDLGFDDHSDGYMERFTDVNVEYQEDIPSHLYWDHSEDLLYVADTGNSRILVVDPSTSELGNQMATVEPGTVMVARTGATVTVLADADDNLGWPSGITVWNDMVLITDAKHSNVCAFDKTTGDIIDWLEFDLPEGSLMGLEVDDEDKLWVIDHTGNRLLRISAK